MIRSRDTNKYADYYLLLEKALKYYGDFEKLKMQNKIEKLENTLHDRVTSTILKILSVLCNKRSDKTHSKTIKKIQ